MTWWPARPEAVRIDSGWNWTAQRPAAGSSMAITTPSGVVGGHLEAALDLLRPRVDGVVARTGELPGQPVEQLAARDLDDARLAVRGLGQQGQLPARVLDHGLQPQAHAEHRQPPGVEFG